MEKSFKIISKRKNKYNIIFNFLPNKENNLLIIAFVLSCEIAFIALKIRKNILRFLFLEILII